MRKPSSQAAALREGLDLTRENQIKALKVFDTPRDITLVFMRGNGSSAAAPGVSQRALGA